MKRFTMSIALVAFLAAMAAPLALAQGSSAPATTPAASSTEKPAAAPKTMKAEHAMAAPKVDINSASKEDLMKLPGVGDAIADKIIAARPFKTKGALTTQKILGPKAYAKVRNLIIAKQAENSAAK